MAIKSPQTYADWYWAKQVEATAAYDEQIEAAFAPYFAGLFTEMPDIPELPVGLRTLIAALSEPPSAGFGGFALGVGVEMVDETLHSLMSPAMKMLQRTINKRAKETWLTSHEANVLFRQGKILEDFWTLITESEGYDNLIAKFLYQAELPYPSIPDIMMYARYQGEPSNIRSEVWKWFDVPERDFELWRWLSLMKLTTDHAHTLYRREFIDESTLSLMLEQIGWDKEDIAYIKELNWTVPNAMLLVQGDLHAGIGTSEILSDISRAGIHPDYAQRYLDAILTKPSVSDLIAYNLRIDPELSGFENTLNRIGIHPDYFDVYKTLAYQIPPVADIITMAVREAFTPAIAERFGQYEDFPEEFSTYAAMKGLTPEWSKRYWAAHWSLPSTMQGFEMLHRGIIDEDTLKMLLRALDVMPFWRDKLIQMAYTPYTRVDIRRMYQQGVLNTDEVLVAYKAIGYDDDHAKKLSDFTVRQTLASMSGFTSTDIVSAYTNKLINRSDAADHLSKMGIAYSDTAYILDSADNKRQWDSKQEQIKGLRNLYRRKVNNETQTRSKLSSLGLPTDYIDDLLDQWLTAGISEGEKYWTVSQTLTYLKKHLITSARATSELKDIGYDNEHIDIYLRSIIEEVSPE